MNDQEYRDADSIYKYRKYLALAFVFFVIYVCVYFPMCVRHGVAVEEAQFRSDHNPLVLLCNGRWGIFLFRYLTHSGVCLPYAAGILAGMFISFALIFQVKLLKLSLLTHKIAYAVFYFSCSSWAYMLRYSNQSHAIALGILCLSIAVYIQFENRPTFKWFLLSSVLLCYAISTYQTVALYYAVLVIAAFLVRYMKEGFVFEWRKYVYICASVVLSVCLYYAVGKLMMTIFSPSNALILHVKEYQQGMTGYSYFWHAPLRAKCHLLEYFVLKTPVENLLGNTYRGQFIVSLSFIPAMVLVFILLKRRFFLGVVGVAFLMVLPYLGGLLLLRGVPVRTFVAEPAAFACVWALALPYMRWDKKGLNAAMILVMGYAFVFSACRVATISRDEHWAWVRSKEEVLHMYQMARQVARESGLPACKMYILGRTPISTDHLFDFEDVGFLPDEVYPNIIKGKLWTNLYLNYLRLPNLRRGDAADIERHREVFDEMSTWPNAGSVKMSKGEVVIRVGD